MYQEENRKQRFITMGEIMLRLTPPDCEKIRTADCFEARYGGSEANVALSLANLGIDIALKDFHDLNLLTQKYGKKTFQDTKIGDRKSTRLNSSHITRSRMPSSA